jgi:hypothetical protein
MGRGNRGQRRRRVLLPDLPSRQMAATIAREIIGHWRKTGRRAAGGDEDDAPAAVSREQLSRPGVHK